MAKIKKLPSGSYRMQVQRDGIRKSFTASTKNQVMLQAAAWLNSYVPSPEGRPLIDVVGEYISKNETVLSPSTINGYSIIYKRLKKYDIAKRDIVRITSGDLQEFIKELSFEYSPKTIKNTYGLISSTFAFYGLLIPKGINLPRNDKKSFILPSEKELRHIIDICNDKELKIAILLAAFCGLRESEVSALTSNDLEGNILSIHSAYVKGADNLLHLKTTKTKSSTRQIIVPDFIVKELKKIDGRFVPISPAAISRRWSRLAAREGIKTRFHDLRHYSASLMHAEGIPDQYIMQKHGWKTDYTLKNIYRNEIDEYTESMNKKFNDILSEKFN